MVRAAAAAKWRSHCGGHAGGRPLTGACPEHVAPRRHPDRNRAPGQEERAQKAERNFRLVARAHEVLTDATLRAAYDRGENVDDPAVQRRYEQR